MANSPSPLNRLGLPSQVAGLIRAEIVRGAHVIAPVQPEQVVEAGDILVFTGDLTRLDLLTRFQGLQTHGQHYRLPLDNLVEVVVAANSTLVRRTIKEVDFRSQFDAAVIAARSVMACALRRSV